MAPSTIAHFTGYCLDHKNTLTNVRSQLLLGCSSKYFVMISLSSSSVLLKIISFILCSNSKLVKSTSDEGIPRHCTHRSSRPSDNCNFHSSEYSTFSTLITRHAPNIIYVLFTALPKTKLHSCNIYEALSAFFTISLISLETPKSAAGSTVNLELCAGYFPPVPT